MDAMYRTAEWPTTEEMAKWASVQAEPSFILRKGTVTWRAPRSFDNGSYHTLGYNCTWADYLRLQAEMYSRMAQVADEAEDGGA